MVYDLESLLSSAPVSISFIFSAKRGH